MDPEWPQNQNLPCHPLASKIQATLSNEHGFDTLMSAVTGGASCAVPTSKVNKKGEDMMD